MAETLGSIVGLSWIFYIMIFFIVSNIVSAFIASEIAKRKGRGPVAWALMGLCCGSVAVILVYCAEPTPINRTPIRQP